MKYLRTTLTVRGPAPDITRFRTAVRPAGKHFDLSLATLVPVPLLHVDDQKSPYRMRLTEWGTPWDVRAILVSETGQCLDYEFKSAFSPPVAWLGAVSAKFPSLEFLLEYEDPLEETHGSAWAKAGKCR
jgi:hypothetical protein